MTIGERLIIAMRFRGVEPFQLAKMAGVDVAIVQRVATNARKNFWHTSIAKLAAALKIRGTWLSIEEGQMLESASTERLHDRSEWRKVATAVRKTHGELNPATIDAVGLILDDREAWPGPLDAPLVATLAAARAAWQTRVGNAAGSDQ